MGCCGSNDLKEQVRERYGTIASAGSTGCGCGCGSESVPDYSVFKDDYQGLDGYVPEADLNLGCGLPTEYANIREGDTVIDLGSGAGNDCFVARRLVGETGEVIGIDFTPEMVARARENAARLGFANVKFRLGDIENIPVTANKADVVISNCVINLVPDKHMAFHEIMRVLRPGGHFCISDVVTEGLIPPGLLRQAELYAGCIAGAVPVEQYVDIIEKTGFRNVEIQKKKSVDIPDALLAEFLTPDEATLFRECGVGLWSITITWSIERKSHVMSLAADSGLALFAGLNTIPKKSFLSEYSHRL
ncbi:MAG: arsenite methyltransferase, partial [Bacteroidales bacterium]